MRLLVQDHTGHSTHTLGVDITEEEVRARFRELTGKSYFAAVGSVNDAVAVKELPEDLTTLDEILLLGPSQGG